MGNTTSTTNFTLDSDYAYGLPINTSESFCILTNKSKIIDVNDNFCNLMKCKKEEILGNPIHNYPKKQKQLGVSSKTAIKQISDMLQNLKGNYQFTWELKRFNDEHFFSIVNLCCGQFNHETVFRATLKEIETPLPQTNNNKTNQFSELMPQFIQQHIQQIQGNLLESSIKGSKSEKEILYHLYSLSQKYKNSINDLHKEITTIKNSQKISNLDNYDQNTFNYRNFLLNQEHSFDVMYINKNKERKKTRIIVSIGHIILRIENEHFLITNSSKILIKLHPKYDCVLKMVWEDQRFVFAFLSVESKKIFLEKLKTLFKKSIDSINKTMDDEDDEEEEDEEEEVIEEEIGENGNSNNNENQNNEISEIIKSKVNEDTIEKKITSSKIDENNNSNNNENSTDDENEENNNENEKNNNDNNETNNEKNNESNNNNTTDNQNNTKSSMGKSGSLTNENSGNQKHNNQKNTEKNKFNIYNPKIEYTNVWSVYVLKANENSLETGKLHLGKGEFLLKSRSFCLQLDYQQNLLVTRNPMRKRNIKFQYEDNIYEATFSEDIFADEFMKSYQKNLKNFDPKNLSPREFSMQTQNMIDFLSDKLWDDDEEGGGDNDDDYEDSNSMFMLDFLNMDQNWELIQQQQPQVMAEFRASIVDEQVKSNKVVIIKVVGNTKLMFGELEFLIMELKVKESSSKKSVVNIVFPGQRKSVSIMFKDSEERKKFMNLYKMNSKALSKLKREEKKKKKLQRRMHKRNSSTSSHSRDSSLKKKFLHFRGRSVFDNESQNKSENFDIPKSQSTSSSSISSKSVNDKPYRFGELSESSKIHEKKIKKHSDGIIKKNNHTSKLQTTSSTSSVSSTSSKRENENESKKVRERGKSKGKNKGREREKEKEKEKEKENESESESERERESNYNYNDENKSNKLLESIQLKVFTSKYEWKRGIFNFYKNDDIELITPEKTFKSRDSLSFRLIGHPTRKKVSKFKINNKNVLIKFSSESERNIFTKKFDTNYESKKTLFIILIFWSSYQGKEIKRKRCQINVINDKLLFVLENNKQVKVPIPPQTKLFLNPSRPRLVKIDFPNKDFFILNFQDSLELKRFVEIVRSIIDFY
ncbi:fip1-like 1 protein [Anaeramoeba flamelloides]|uniref:Fip1-like 1 protein n=1 Tax=Anaeramoeba flamelloides TaxID=1746091 RepID=A0ABQ8YEG6_9EUKA|nr:fip1-like 1 protein [Anaeramoeba flamelloides]